MEHKADEAFDRVWKHHLDMLRSARSAVAVEELPTEDVAQLLEDYKTLRAENEKLRRRIKDIAANVKRAMEDME